uniref:Uncharacterized protein n=1 Tax=Manihot esculenta TaxID=3983 RepID=A0A2C9UE61_MANES
MSRNSLKSLVPKCRRVSISSGKKALVLVKTLQLQENKEKKEQPENVCHGCTSELNGLIFYAQRLSFPSVSSIPVKSADDACLLVVRIGGVDSSHANSMSPLSLSLCVCVISKVCCS